MMDIEGDEPDFLRHADLRGVTVFVAEFHHAVYGREGMQDCRRFLGDAGLEKDAEFSRSGVHVYRRG